MAFEFVINEAIVQGYNKLLVEMDCNRVVNALWRVPFPTKRWDDYRNLPLNSSKGYDICHIPREGNEVAGLLVRITKLETKK